MKPLIKDYPLCLPVFAGVDTSEYYCHYCAPEPTYKVNGTAAPLALLSSARQIITAHTACPYCGTALQKRELPRRSSDRSKTVYKRTLAICPCCQFWYATNDADRDQGPWDRYTSRRIGAAILERLPIDLPEPPLHELIRHLQKHPHTVRHIHPRAFEQLVGECFRANWGAVEVKYVGGPDDGGVDVILVMSDRKKWLLQCKRREHEDHVESVRTVRELLGTLLAEGELRGVVVSTADHFSYHAQRLSKEARLQDCGYEIRLADYGLLREMLTCKPAQGLADSDRVPSSSDPLIHSFFEKAD